MRDCGSFASDMYLHIHFAEFNPISRAHGTCNPRQLQKKITYRESRCACTSSHTDTPSQVPCGRMSGTRRVEGPFTIYRQKPMGFPSVYREFSRSLRPTHSGSLCEILERDSRRPCRGYAGEAKGEVGHVVGGVSEGVSWPTGLHGNLVLSRPAGSEGR